MSIISTRLHGDRIVQGKRVSLAQAAGAYPKSLVQAVARVVNKRLNPNGCFYKKHR